MQEIPTSSSTTRILDLFATKYVREMRFKLKHPEKNMITSVYLLRTDSNRYCVKVFRNGKCLVAKYIIADKWADLLIKVNWADLLNNVNSTLFNQ